jgi:hypothetical protein
VKGIAICSKAINRLAAPVKPGEPGQKRHESASADFVYRSAGIYSRAKRQDFFLDNIALKAYLQASTVHQTSQKGF